MLPVLSCQNIFSYYLLCTVRDLAIVPDLELSFSAYINHLTRSCYYQPYQLRAVSHSLSCDASAILVPAFATCRLYNI